MINLIGTKSTKKETHQAEEGIFWDSKTRQKSVRELEEYVIHPNQIKNLKLGQALLYCSKMDRHHTIMNIKRANSFIGRYERKNKNDKLNNLIQRDSSTFNDHTNRDAQVSYFI